MDFYELNNQGYATNDVHISFGLYPAIIRIFNGENFIKKQFKFDHFPICPCSRCRMRVLKGLRPISFFSPNHNTARMDMRILVFDTETTGLPTYRNASVSDSDAWPHIVQWSWIVFDMKKQAIVSIHDHIMRLPTNKSIPEESTKIHGITNERMRKEGRFFKDVYSQFVADYETCNYLVAHNLEFDRKMIEAECFRNHLPVNSIWTRKRLTEYCTMKRSKALCGMKGTYQYGKDKGKQYIRYPKLIELHQTLFDTESNKTTLNNLHNSMMDILVCFRCFYVIAFEKDPLEYKDVVLGLYDLWSQVYGKEYMRMLRHLILQRYRE